MKKLRIKIDPKKVVQECLKSVRPHLTDKSFKTLKRALKERQDDIEKHFKTRGHGWELDYHCVVSDVLETAVPGLSSVLYYGLGFGPNWGHAVIGNKNAYYLVKKGKR